MHLPGYQTRVIEALNAVVQIDIDVEIVQIVFTVELFCHCDRWHAYVTGANVEGLQPVVRPVFLDNEQSLQSHHDMYVGLDMAMIKHGATLTRLQVIGTCATGQHRFLAGQRGTVVAFTLRIDEWMVYSVKVNRVRHVMTVFQGDFYSVALFNANRR